MGMCLFGATALCASKAFNNKLLTEKSNILLEGFSLWTQLVLSFEPTMLGAINQPTSLWELSHGQSQKDRL